MRRIRIGRVLGSGRWRGLRVGAAALAALGVVGVLSPAVALASPQQPLNWTKLTPPTSPYARTGQSMAYDGATGTVVLFGGAASGCCLGDTWTWDGTTWTKQHPAASPPGRTLAAMAYDAATGTVVLFGGTSRHGILGDTWTWDGTTWTEQHPATSPPGRYLAYMAYDAATGTVVLYGGAARGTGNLCYLGRTWTWDGTTWTAQTPAAHPSARAEGAMVYDAATGTVVLFGGSGYATTRCSGSRTVRFEQTWTWG